VPRGHTLDGMVRRVVRGVVAGLSLAVAWIGAAPARALADPEVPPAAFVPAPPDHQPGSSQYVPPSETEPPPRAASDEGLPMFMTLDRTATGPHAGIQVGFNKFDDVSLSDGFAMRFNPYGQYIFPNRVAGIYGQLPIAHLFDFTGADGTGVGNFEMGGLYLPMGDSRLILRAGLALPTASDSGEGIIANASTTFERLTDFVLFPPDYTTFRLSASTVQRMDMFFLRVDGGFDLVFSRPTGDDGPNVFFRANVAGGVRTSVVDFTLELVNLAFVNGDVGGGITERFNHTAALGVRTQGQDQFHFGTIFPLDEAARGEVWILSLGYMRAFN
jgi:hypothetical protein